jgi:hypothetical protein
MVYFTLFDLLLPRRETGRITFSTELTRPVVGDKGDSPTVDFGAHVLELLAGYGLFTLRFERNKASLEELDIEALAEEGTPYHDVSFNMAKMARLPALNPAAELQELHDLFESLKPFYVTHAAAMPRIAIMNYRDEEGHTFGALDLGLRYATDEETAQAKAASEEAMRRIKASPVLDAWLQQLAMDLDTVGPYSWYNLADEHFFSIEENPVMECLRSNQEPRKSSQTMEEPFGGSHIPTWDGRRGRKKNTGKRYVFL